MEPEAPLFLALLWGCLSSLRVSRGGGGARQGAQQTAAVAVGAMGCGAGFSSLSTAFRPSFLGLRSLWVSVYPLRYAEWLLDANGQRMVTAAPWPEERPHREAPWWVLRVWALLGPRCCPGAMWFVAGARGQC